MRTLGYLGCWLVSILGWLCVAMALRDAAFRVSNSAGVSHWVLGLVDKSALVIAILGWLIIAMVSEPLYARAAAERALRRRFVQMIVAQVVIGGVLALVIIAAR